MRHVSPGAARAEANHTLSIWMKATVRLRYATVPKPMARAWHAPMGKMVCAYWLRLIVVSSLCVFTPRISSTGFVLRSYAQLIAINSPYLDFEGCMPLQTPQLLLAGVDSK